MEVTFFGVRGSCPCAGDRYQRTGGNTSCVAVSVDGEIALILDLGTGLRSLGDRLCAGPRQGPLAATALLTHLHFDHILGLPFFAPLLDPGTVLTVYGPPQDAGSLRDALAGVIQPPFFPVPMAELAGDLDVREVAGEEFSVGPVTVRAARVPHPGPTLGFRLRVGDTSVAYVPDHQAPPDRETVPDTVRSLCEGADLLLHDAQYDDGELAEKSGWGHSTAAYAVRVAAECGAGRLLLFHHDPAHSDRDLDELLRQARRLPDAHRIGDVSLAAEGMTVRA